MSDFLGVVLNARSLRDVTSESGGEHTSVFFVHWYVTLKIILENELLSQVMKYSTPILCKKNTISKCDLALPRELTLEQLNESLDRLTVIVEERREAEGDLRQQQEELIRKITEYKEKLHADSIDLSELLPDKPEVEKNSKRPAKYHYIDSDCQTKTWTDQDRQSVPIRDAIANGKSLDDFLINQGRT